MECARYLPRYPTGPLPHELMMAIDPICGMTVDPATAAGRYDYKGTAYYFCALSCLEKFKADPERTLQPPSSGLITLGGKNLFP
jgi:P-type Cu+ transporter